MRRSVAFAALHTKIGADRAVIVNATLHGLDNRVVTDAIAVSGGLYKGIANIDDDDRRTRNLAALDKAGIRGCRFAFLKRRGGIGDMNVFKRLGGSGPPPSAGMSILSRARKHPLSSLPILTVAADHLCHRSHGYDRSGQGGVDDPEFKALLDLQKR